MMSDSVNQASAVTSGLSDRQRRILVAILLLIGVFFVAFYGVRAYRGWRRLIEGSQPIVRPWMTIPHVAHQFKIPAQELYRALAVQPEQPDRRPLGMLAKQKGVKTPAFVEQVQRFVDSYHKPPLPAPSPPIPVTPPPAPLQSSLRGRANAHGS